MKFFHGTTANADFSNSNPVTGRYDICMTTRPEVAADYIGHNRCHGGYLFEFSVDAEVTFASPEQADEIAEELWGDVPECRIEEMYDNPEFHDAVVSAGFDGVEYGDMTPRGKTHTTYRVFCSDVAEIVGVHDGDYAIGRLEIGADPTVAFDGDYDADEVAEFFGENATVIGRDCYGDLAVVIPDGQGVEVDYM